MDAVEAENAKLKAALANMSAANKSAEEITSQKVASSIGYMLLGMVLFMVSLFYAANFPDKDVQKATWITLSEAISLLMGVLIFASIKDLFVLQFGESGGHTHGQPDTSSLSTSFIRMLFIF